MTALARLDEERSLSAAELSRRLRGLPLCDPGDLDRTAGFVRLVRTLVVGPLTSLGLLAATAGLAVGEYALASLAAGMTGLIVYSLWHDTQLTKSIELLRRGQLSAAESGMRRVADDADRPAPQRQRARTYLAAIGWARGDHEMALEWTRARNTTISDPRTPAEERYRSRATEVQLLALLGRSAEARHALGSLPEEPDDQDARMTAATTRLLVAFATSDPDSVARDLDAWQAKFLLEDDLGLFTALLAWCRDALGQREAAVWLVARLSDHGDAQFLRAHLPALWRWLERFDAVGRRYG